MTADKADHDPEPLLLPGSGFYLAAFWELNSDRPIGMAVAQIPFSAIDRFADRNGIEGEEFEFLVHMIRAMDAVAMAHWREDTPAQAKSEQGGRSLSPELFDALWG